MEQAELYRKYRPTTFDEIVGQPTAVTVLKEWIRKGTVPHAMLFSGPSGCGKTTIARILKEKLECSDHDFFELNAADTRGIDTVRDIRERMGLAPMNGKCRIYYLDEAHQLSRRSGGDAQTALLKMLEDTPNHIYFILTTTHSQGLLPTIRTRCSEIKLNSLDTKSMETLLKSVLVQEKRKVAEDVLEKIINVASGSARKGLVILHQVLCVRDPEEQLELIDKVDSTRNVYDLVKALLWSRSDWLEIAKIIQGLGEEQEWEKIRHLILKNASNEILKNWKTAGRAYQILCSFEGNWNDSGRAGLIRACWEVLQR